MAIFFLRSRVQTCPKLAVEISMAKVPHGLMCSHPWSKLVVLFWELMEPLRGGVGLRKCITGGRSWGFTFHYLYPSLYLWMNVTSMLLIVRLADCVPAPFPQWPISRLERQTQKNPFPSKLLLVMVLTITENWLMPNPCYILDHKRNRSAYFVAWLLISVLSWKQF